MAQRLGALHAIARPSPDSPYSESFAVFRVIRRIPSHSPFFESFAVFLVIRRIPSRSPYSGSFAVFRVIRRIPSPDSPHSDSLAVFRVILPCSEPLDSSAAAGRAAAGRGRAPRLSSCRVSFAPPRQFPGPRDSWRIRVSFRVGGGFKVSSRSSRAAPERSDRLRSDIYRYI